MEMNDMTFGVEIECFIPYGAVSNSGWVVAGYNGRGPIPGHQGWNATSDSTIHAAAGCQPIEVVSPVLRGVEGFRSLKAMCDTLARLGARVNSSCGLHVHVGFSRADENADALRRLIIHCANVEKAVYASTGTHARENHYYSMPIHELYRSVKNTAATTVDGVIRSAQGREGRENRYRMLNLNCLLQRERDTVEFRAFAGTTSYTKIAGHIMTCVGLVQFSHESKIAQPYDAKPTTGKSSRYVGGQGLVALNRLMMHLGWIAGYKRPKAYGVPDEMRGRELKAIIKELRRLAAKYDAEVG